MTRNPVVDMEGQVNGGGDWRERGGKGGEGENFLVLVY